MSKVVTQDEAIHILGQVVAGWFTWNDEFKEACRMGQRALLIYKERQDEWWREQSKCEIRES